MSPAKMRIRVGVDFHEWDGIFQGSRSHVFGVYREAIVQAPDVDFVFFLDGVDSLRKAAAAFQRPNVSFVRMKKAHGLVRLGLLLPWLCLRHGIDVLHTQYRVPFLKTTSLACTIHDLLFETHPEFFPDGFVREAKLTYRLSIKRADALFSVSAYSRSEICRIHHVPPEKVLVTYNGVDRTRFFPGDAGAQRLQDLGLSSGEYILMVGRLEPRKNHLALIRAWSKISGAPQLVIVGQEDSSFPEVCSAINEFARTHAVKQFKRLGDELLPIVMRHARVFVYPAFAEGFGMPVAEALASGVPVLTSNTTSLPEVAGESAILFDPRDELDIQLALQRALELSSEARMQMVQRGLQQVARFDWAQSAAVLLAGLRQAAQGR